MLYIGLTDKMANKEKILKKLRERYKQERILRDDAVDMAKKFRLEVAKYTFADLESGGKNTYINTLKKKDRYFSRRFKIKEAVLNRLDRKIDQLMF